MFFSKDTGARIGFSKFNALAVSCARYMHDIRYADCTVTSDLVIDQCGDGRIIHSSNSRRRWVVLHDWYDHYMPYVGDAVRVICLGRFTHPDFKKHTVAFPSYPIEPRKLPICESLGTLIAGMYNPDDSGKIIDAVCGIGCRTATLAAYADDSIDVERSLDLLAESLTVNGINVTRKYNVSDAMIFDYYMSSASIVHCGSAKYGLLHSLAVDRISDGVILKCVHNYDLIKPCYIDEFIQYLKTG